MQYARGRGVAILQNDMMQKIMIKHYNKTALIWFLSYLAVLLIPFFLNGFIYSQSEKNIKKSFKAKEGYVYIDADYSQIELRVLAHISKDETMIKAFKNDEDIHREVASKVFGVPITKVTKEQRSNAKAVNFGIIYGITAFGLSQQLKIGRKEAQSYIDNYLKKYGGIKEFMDGIVKKLKKRALQKHFLEEEGMCQS